MVMGISNEDMEAWARKVCFPQISLLSDWDSHLGTRKNSGSVETSKKAPISSRIPRTITTIRLLNASHTRSSIGGGGAKVADWDLVMI